MFLQQISIFLLISLATIRAHLDTQIASGHDAPDGKYPFQVSIQSRNNHICSGTIIDVRHILTSSFCFTDDIANVDLLVGTNSLSTGGQKLRVQEFIKHEELSHNIALIRTREDIHFNDKIKPIAIANEDYREPGYPVIFLSWKRPVQSNKNYSARLGNDTNDKLQEIKKKLYDQDECKSLYQNIGEQDLCTIGESGEDDCDINIGSPIIADGVQIGIRTVAPCGVNVVARNIRVFYYRDWFLNNTNLMMHQINLYFQNVNCEWNEENYPHHVSIRYEGRHVCSGSIITSRYILTTKKCVTRYGSVEKLSIIVGTNSLVNGGDTYGIQEIIKHNNSRSDIALLVTCNDICFNENIYPIGISTSKNEQNCDVVKLTAFKQPPNGMPTTVKLQAYKYEICNDFQCQKKYNYENMFLCLIKYDRARVCNADFGGGIIANKKLIGIKLYGVSAHILPREYSYHVSIQFHGEHECSGSIINSRHILTAYQCVISTSAKDLSVLVGTTSLKRGGVLYKIEDIILQDNALNDIALLRTRDEINFDYNVQPINIANFNYNKNGDKVLITAWEKPPRGVKRKNNEMQHFFHQFYDERTCTEQNHFLKQIYMCTIDPTGQGLCNMDYGGAIVANGLQIGVNLNNDACIDGNKFKSHILISKFADWIYLNSNLGNIINSSGSSITPNHCFNISHETPFGKYPYHVSVRRNNEHICSGSIINKRYIITSQICIIRDSAADLNIIVGTNSLATYPGILHEIEKIITYNGDDDFIALLQTKENIKFNEFTKPIAITNYNYEVGNSPVTFTAFEQPISGKITNDRLQEFSNVIYDLKKCNKYYNEYFDQTTLCTVDLCQRNICNMDYGGGVVANGVLIGIKLYTIEKCDKNQPQVNIRVHHYINWIRTNSDLSKFSYSQTPRDWNVQTSIEFKKDSREERFPYHVSIKRSNQHLCSGSIINERHILTSYGCILRDTAKDLFVITGTNSLTKSGQLYKINKIIPTYNSDYGIALLRTTNKIIFNDDVKSINISPYSQDLYKSESAILTAWERPINGKYINDKLQQVLYKISDRSKCLQNFPSLDDAYICSIQISYENGCNMDYGAPIVSNGLQIAINPFGVRCDGYNKPQLHLPLYPHLGWIRENSRVY
ncbi:hypothetical protein PV326_012831 [Microctonus aethiopoides]|nr:hypothetical protein PV326_012831 [Microctonus aethiopoides]